MEIDPTAVDWSTMSDTAVVALADDGVPEAVAELARREDADEADGLS